MNRFVLLVHINDYNNFALNFIEIDGLILVGFVPLRFCIIFETKNNNFHILDMG